MAGTGKSTFTARLNNWVSSFEQLNINQKTGMNSDLTLVNLDPAVIKTKTPLDVDIREFHDIENIMKTYNLGPNGAVTTTLNLFLMQWDANIESKYTIIDTPGQIEAFVWSNGGKVLVEKFTKRNNKLFILYLLDSEECARSSVFMCNMMYALMIKMRFNVPVILVFNKVDLAPVPIEWIENFEKFMEDVEEDETMNGPILRGMALHFEEYYKNFDYVGVSAFTGTGKKEFFDCIEKVKSDGRSF